MILIDQHMHTHHSFDSKEAMENYIIQTDGFIVTTEHLDFNDPAGDYVDRIPDYDRYSKEVQELNTRYNDRILKGIEIGWTAKDHHQTLQFLENKNYDLALLSVHQNGFYDYMDPRGFLDYEIERLIPMYLQSLHEALVNMHEYVDVMAHFDYGFRIHNISPIELKHYGEEDLIRLFDFIIAHNIAFELNTSSMYKHQNLALYEYAIGIYLNQGGSLFTLGSDAHFAKDYRRNFDDAIALLKRYDVNSVVCFIDHHAHPVDI